MELLAIVGPTAVGKTAVALSLAEQLGGELISADAVAVYRGLDIGAAKPTAAERARVPIHLLDVAEPADDFTLADFERLGQQAIDQIRQRGKLPIIVGGTGLYVRALTAILTLPEVPPQPEFRAARWVEVERDGAAALHQRLAAIDPPAAAKIHPGDAKRIIRALEVHAVTGQPISAFHTPEGVHGVPRPGSVLIGIDADREWLYRQIDARVLAMLDAGFREEVANLLSGGVPADCKSMQSLGYRHLVQLMRGTLSESEAVALIQRDTRRYAKRQWMWFRQDPAIRWVKREADESTESVASRIRERVSE